jgi:catechol 2,3-dioxygenase-like lactoylglutathione lyase family enzyme
MLKHGRVATRLPAQDLERARRFYSERLGLEPTEEREGGLRYVCAPGEFALFQSARSAAGDHTQMMWEVTTSKRPSASCANGASCSRRTTYPV